MGVTQRAAANDIGICKRTVERFELGRFTPRPSTCRLIEMWIERNQPRKELEL